MPHIAGTIAPAKAPMRLMPPRITRPTSTARTTPTIGCGTPKDSSVTTPTFQAWNMLPPVIVEISRVMQKSTPSVRPSQASLGLR